jgi:small-conductance mechanosensitive channel
LPILGRDERRRRGAPGRRLRRSEPGQDFIGGFFILLEDQIRVGDVVQIGDKSGLVEKVNLRLNILRDEVGSVHFIRNGKIDVVTNMTKDYSHYVFNLGIAYRENVDEVIRVLKGIDEEMRSDAAFKDDILEPLEVLGLIPSATPPSTSRPAPRPNQSSNGASDASSTAASR